MSNDQAVPQGKLKRSQIASSAVLKMGVREAGFRLKQSWKSPNPVDQASHEDQQAKTLFQALSQLRGTALKAAQMLGQDFEFLPEAYRRELSKAAYQVPALNRALVRKQFIKEQGKPPEHCFDFFEPEAFAAASLGQVHRAELNHEPLAVKIQYPGIGHSIEDDLQLMNQLFRGLPNRELLQQGLDEVRERLVEEVDYRLEAQRTKWFFQQIKHPRLVVPKVYPELSGDRILVTQRLEGQHLDQWLASNPTQEERNHYGQMLFDLYDYSLQQKHRLHADPNPGNYLFMSGGRLGWLDFGCVKVVEPEFVVLVNQMLDAILASDLNQLRYCYGQLGIDYAEGAEADRHLNQWMDWFVTPYIVPYFDAAAHRGYINEGARLFSGHQKHLRHLNQDLLYLDRNWLGLFRMVEQIGSVVDFRRGRDNLFGPA